MTAFTPLGGRGALVAFAGSAAEEARHAVPNAASKKAEMVGRFITLIMRNGVWLLPLALIWGGCAKKEPTAAQKADAAAVFEEGIASVYSDNLAGKPTASGESYDPKKATCAHRTLPLGTVVEVERITNGRRIKCKINDRGPFSDERIIDLSRTVADALQVQGISKVKLRKVN